VSVPARRARRPAALPAACALAARPLLLALALACLGARTAAGWQQRTFLIGAFGSDTLPTPPMRLVAMNDAGLDWVGLSRQATLAAAAALNQRFDSLRAMRRGFRLQNLVTYELPSDPVRAPGRLMHNVDAPLALGAIDAVLGPGRGLNTRATFGWLVWDEPCEPADFTNLGIVSRHIGRLPGAAHGLPYTNLMAMYAWDVTAHQPASCYYRHFGPGAGHAAEDGYRAYLRAYLEQFDARHPAPVLSVDHYPFQVPDHPQRDYFWTLRLLREEASRAAGGGRPVPVWIMVQLSPFHRPGEDAFPANFGFVNTRWQVWCALAYGAKGIEYWGLRTFRNLPSEGVWGPGIFTDAGDTLGPCNAQVRALNRELHRLGPTLMRLDAVAAWHVDSLGWLGLRSELFDPARGTPIVARFGAGSDSAFAGWLRDRARGDDYLMVVNKGLYAPATFTVTLTRRAAAILRIDRSTGRAVQVGRGTSVITLRRLPPGQGELFRIVRTARR
jgi:hypothetical protein